MAIKTYPKGSKEKVSANFYAYEFDCPGKGCCTETPIDDVLVDIVQGLRDETGKPVHILAYRCPVHNAKVKNASKKSKHMLGMAADITVDDHKPIEVARILERRGVKGIGLYEGKDGNFVHGDSREKKSFWYGHAQEYRSTFCINPSTEEYNLETFIKEVQQACGAKVDGIAGPETLQKTVTLSAVKNRKHPAVAPVQRRLHALGYTVVGKADGITGPKFEAAIINFQEDNHCWVDGEITARNKTWRKLLGME